MQAVSKKLGVLDVKGSTFMLMRKMVPGRLSDLSTPYAPEWQPADHRPDAPWLHSNGRVNMSTHI